MSNQDWIFKPRTRRTNSQPPTVAALQDGEIAINLPSKTIYYRDADTVVPIASYTDPASYVNVSSNQVDIAGDKGWTGKHSFADLVTIGNSLTVDGISIDSPTSGSVRFGTAALAQAGVSGTDLTAVGAYALSNRTSGSSHTAIGYRALFNHVNGDGSTAVGANSGEAGLGSQSVAVGYSALRFATMGFNTAIGATAGMGVTTGTENVLVGYGAGNGSVLDGRTAVTTGDGNTFIGTRAGVSSEDQVSYSTVLGYRATVDVSDSVTLGFTSTNDRAQTVSVGNDTLKRQITNVAAGTAPNDAVNLQQLQSVVASSALPDGDYGDIVVSNDASVWMLDEGVVDSIKLADDAVIADKIENSAVTTNKINNSAVTAVKLASNAVTTVKVQNAAVTNAKLANMATGTLKGNDGAAGAPKDLTAEQVRALLELPTRYQGLHANLTSLAGLSLSNQQGIYSSNASGDLATYSLTAAGRALGGVAGTANTFPYFSSTNTAQLAPVTAFARSILDDTSAAAVRTTIGAGVGSVTSVGVAVPTGLNATAPITSSGTITLSYASGYQGFTTAQAGEIASLATTYVPLSQRNTANGYAGLDADAKIPSNLLPSIALTDTFTVANQAAMLALDVQRGDLAIRTDVSKTFVLREEPATTLANWSEILSPTDAVKSVNVSGGTTGLTATGGPITNTGVITLAGTVALSHGGTGATTAAAARSNLGLSTMAVQASSNVNITGGTIGANVNIAGRVIDGGTY